MKIQGTIVGYDACTESHCPHITIELNRGPENISIPLNKEVEIDLGDDEK